MSEQDKNSSQSSSGRSSHGKWEPASSRSNDKRGYRKNDGGHRSYNEDRPRKLRGDRDGRDFNRGERSERNDRKHYDRGERTYGDRPRFSRDDRPRRRDGDSYDRKPFRSYRDNDGEQRGGYRKDGERDFKRGGYRRDDRDFNRGERTDRPYNDRGYKRDDFRGESRGERRWDNDRPRKFRSDRDDRGFNRDDRPFKRDDRPFKRDDRSYSRDDSRGDSRGERRWDNDRPRRHNGEREERKWAQSRGERGGRWDRERRPRGEGEGWKRDRYEDRGRKPFHKDNEEGFGRNTSRPGERPGESKRIPDPELPESVTANMLDPVARRHLLTLSKENAEQVARHLAYAGEMMDLDPKVAYEHAKAAYRHAARIDIVREALGLAAYVNGEYAEALRELRTYRRMSGDWSHTPIEADCERGLGRPEKALAFIAEVPMGQLHLAEQIELAIVAAGARADSGDPARGLETLDKIHVENLPEDLAIRVLETRAGLLEETGADDEAEKIRTRVEEMYAKQLLESEPVDYFDLDEILDDEEPEEDEADDEEEPAEPAERADSAESGESAESPESAESSESAESAESPESAESAESAASADEADDEDEVDEEDEVDVADESADSEDEADDEDSLEDAPEESAEPEEPTKHSDVDNNQGSLF